MSCSMLLWTISSVVVSEYDEEEDGGILRGHILDLLDTQPNGHAQH